MRRRAGLLVATAVMAGAAMIGSAVPAGAMSVGDTQGCTPGYWKNHTSVWQEYSSTTTLSDMLSTVQIVNGHYIFTPYTFPSELSSYGSLTMEQALALRGGPGYDGAAQILLRAATAAYLNASYDIVPGGSQGLFYPFRRWQDTTINGVTYPALQPAVTGALSSLDRSTMIDLASSLDAANNLGCPL